MQISKSIYFLILFLLVQVFCHSHQNIEEERKSNVHIAQEAHLHEIHEDHHHSKVIEEKPSLKPRHSSHSHKDSIDKNIEASNGEGDSLFHSYYSHISKNRVLMVIFAVIIISIPSFPAFLILLFISKVSPDKNKNKNLINEKYLRMMICLAVGSLTGDVFFGMMSHIIDSDHHEHHEDSDSSDHHGHQHKFQPEVFCIIIGIFFFYVVDRAFGGHEHGHELHIDDDSFLNENEKVGQDKTSKEEKKDKELTKSDKTNQDSGIRNRNKNGEKKQKNEKDILNYNADTQNKISKANNRSAILYLVADFLHNVIDGIGIGVAFTVNNSLGIATTVAVATHELPHEIGDFAILLKKNYSLTFILLTQLSTATGALFGGLLG